MGFFDKIFNNPNEQETAKSKINWIELTELKQLQEIISESNKKTVLILKHSTRCSISRMVLKQFENEYDTNNLKNKITPYFLDLLMYRNISNEIENIFKVEHQSPQILLIKNGAAIYNASHESIQAQKLKEFTTKN